MEEKTKILREIIEGSKKILIITHKGPDMDAFCSMLATYGILKEIYPEKDISMKAKQMPNMNLPLMKDIQLVETIDHDGEDLILITDTSSLNECTEKDKDNIQNSSFKIAIIDHHRDIINEERALVINERRSSATEQVYVTFKEAFKDKVIVDENVAMLIQFGILGDTNRFLYDAVSSDTYRIFAEVKDICSVDVEDFSYKFSKFPLDAHPVIIEYLKSLTIERDMAYMYISKETIEKNSYSKQGVNKAQAFLRDNYLRTIQGIHWGFIVKPNLDKEDEWFIIFRSTKDYQDVGVIAESLNGGGHIYASAVKMKAESVEEVINRVLDTIKQVS